MDSKLSPMPTPSKQFPHPSPLPSPQKPVKDTLSSLQPEGTTDPLNDLFLAQLTRIFALKYALSIVASSRLMGSSSREDLAKVRQELHQMLDDLKRVEKWVETTRKQAEKALQEKPAGGRLQPPKVSRLKIWFQAAKKWFEK